MVSRSIKEDHRVFAISGIILRKNLAEPVKEQPHDVTVGVHLCKRQVALAVTTNHGNHADARTYLFHGQSLRLIGCYPLVTPEVVLVEPRLVDVDDAMVFL